MVLPTRYPTAHTLIAVPEGVTLTGPNLTSAGVEPQTRSEVFDLALGAEAAVIIEGSLALRLSGVPGGVGGSPNQITIEDAPVAAEIWWILAIVVGILGIGFLNLSTSRT